MIHMEMSEDILPDSKPTQHDISIKDKRCRIEMRKTVNSFLTKVENNLLKKEVSNKGWQNKWKPNCKKYKLQSIHDYIRFLT